MDIYITPSFCYLHLCHRPHWILHIHPFHICLLSNIRSRSVLTILLKKLFCLLPPIPFGHNCYFPLIMEYTTRYMYSNCQRYKTLCGRPYQPQLDAFETLDLQPPMNGWILSKHCEFVIFLNYDHPVILFYPNSQKLTF